MSDQKNTAEDPNAGAAAEGGGAGGAGGQGGVAESGGQGGVTEGGAAPPADFAPDLGADYDDLDSVILPAEPGGEGAAATAEGEAAGAASGQEEGGAGEAEAGQAEQPPASGEQEGGEAPAAEGRSAEGTPGGQQAGEEGQSSDTSAGPVGPHEALRQLQENRDAVIAELASSRFALSDEDADALDSNPNEAIPRIMAKTYFEAVTTAMTQLQNMVPSMVLQVSSFKEQVQKAGDMFYSQWPQLDRQKHGQVVGQFAKAYREAHPNATPEELIKDVGLMVTTKLGLGEAKPNGNGAAKGGGKPKPSFVPARGGAGAPMAPPEVSPFEGLGGDYDDI